MMHKTKVGTLVVLLCCIIFGGHSCISNELVESENQLVSSGPTTRALTPIVESKSNPELFSNWENIVTVKLNGGGTIDVPWVMVSGNSMNIPDYFRFDIKKENGWEMLYHTLTDEESLEPNYLLFYNRKTGCLKGFYYSLAAENNQNFYWVLEASEPTYSIPANTLVQSYKKNKFITTTNILKDNSVKDIGHLNAGWNAFSFELPYNYSDDSDPVVSIYGYNEEKSEIKLSGDFSGVVNIPKEVFTDDKTLSAIASFTKIASTVLSAYGGIAGFAGQAAIKAALSAVANKTSSVSKFFQTTSTFMKKGEIVTTQGTINGKIQLDGTSIITKSGLVKSIDNVPFNKQKIGLWTLKKTTLYGSKFFIVKFPNGAQDLSCEVSHKLSFEKDDESGFLNSKINKLNLDSFLVVNPLMKGEIESYKVIDASISFELSPFISYIYAKDEGKDKTMSTNYIYDLNKGVFVGDYLHPRIKTDENYIDERKLYQYVVNINIDHTTFEQFQSYLSQYVYGQNEFLIVRNDPVRFAKQTAFVNVVVEFIYKDGHSFISSRNYSINIETNSCNNYSSIEKELLDFNCLFDQYKQSLQWPMPLQSFLWPF